MCLSDQDAAPCHALKAVSTAGVRAVVHGQPLLQAVRERRQSGAVESGYRTDSQLG
jgi:hypothetical protein